MIFQLSTPRVKNARLIWESIKGHPGPGVKGDFHFDGEAVVYFPLELVHMVAEMAGARKKRKLSDEAKARLVERDKASRFQRINHGVEDAETAHI